MLAIMIPDMHEIIPALTSAVGSRKASISGLNPKMHGIISVVIGVASSKEINISCCDSKYTRDNIGT